MRKPLTLVALALTLGAAACEPISAQETGPPYTDYARVTLSARGHGPITIGGTYDRRAADGVFSKTKNFKSGRLVTLTAQGKGKISCHVYEDGKTRDADSGNGFCSVSWRTK